MLPARSLLVIALVLALAGCFGSRGDDRDGGTSSSDSRPGGPCGAAADRELADESPGLAARAAANNHDAATGNRTVRWDLVVSDACQQSSASAAIEARRSPVPQDCPAVDLRASVTTGVSETRIDLAGGEVLTGAATFDPARPDLQAGNATFVVSLSATFASRGSGPQDDQCLDGSVQGFTLRAAYRLHPA